MTSDSERDVGRIFKELRAADARKAPSFHRVIAGVPTRAAQRVLWPAFAASLALVSALTLWRLTRSHRPELEIRAGDLRVPTDFLFDLVSLPLPSAAEIPRIGIDDWYPLDASLNNRSTQ